MCWFQGCSPQRLDISTHGTSRQGGGGLLNFRKMAQLSVILRELTHLQVHEDVPVDANMDLVNTLRVKWFPLVFVFFTLLFLWWGYLHQRKFPGWAWETAFTFGHTRMDVSCAWLGCSVWLSAACIPLYILCCLERRPVVWGYSRQMMWLER